MRLSFSILWFDDSGEYFDSLDIDSLKTEILSWGFFPDIKLVTTPAEFESHSPYTKFDLIVVDRNLEEYGEGQNFIAALRSNAVYTEVIFYTIGNASDLWNAIRDEQLEGVFVSNRGTIRSKISQVGRQSIRKVLDLENMRGIVMAEVGELDHLLDEITKAGMVDLSDEQQKSIFKKFHKGVSEHNQKTGERLTKFLANPDINEMLDLSDSYRRWINFKRLCEKHDKLKSKDQIGDFNAEVLKPRNLLAHGKPERYEGGVYLFRYQEEEFRFDDEASIRLRQTILRYKEAFSDILRTLEA